VEPHFDVFFRQAQGVGCFRRAHFFYVSEHQDCPVFLGQSEKRFFEKTA